MNVAYLLTRTEFAFAELTAVAKSREHFPILSSIGVRSRRRHKELARERKVELACIRQA